MYASRFIAIALTSVLTFTTGQGHATSLDRHSAKVVAALTPMKTAISSRTGARTGRSVPASYGRAADPAFRGMIKLAMKFDMSDGRVMTEHCGGTAIDSRWIVTAAHCVSPAGGESWNRIEIRTGDRDLDGNSIIRRTAFQAIIHAGFEYASLSNDIALLRLREPLPKSVVPARLDAQSAPSLSAGQVAHAAGWPVTGARAGQRQLQTTPVAVKDGDLPGYITVTSPTGQAEGVCQGESGGPLMARTADGARLAGILSGIAPGTHDATGEPCMVGGYEMYFTPIAAYRGWIDSVMSVCGHNPEVCSADQPIRIASLR